MSNEIREVREIRTIGTIRTIRSIGTIGTIRRGYHFPIIPIFPIFPINFTSISNTISCQKGLDLAYRKSEHPRIVLKRTASGAQLFGISQR